MTRQGPARCGFRNRRFAGVMGKRRLATVHPRTPELHVEIGVYRCMSRKPYRIMLPLIVGCVSCLLIIWDLHNNRVIASMGMAWDTGPPVWPYEASWIALVSINAPAYVLSAPLFLLLHAQTSPQCYPLFFPVIIIWWWWLGSRIDLGLFPSRSHRHRWRVSVSLMAAALSLYCLGILAILDYARWWSEYGYSGMRLLRTAGPMLWCFALAVALTVSALRAIGRGRRVGPRLRRNFPISGREGVCGN